MPKPYTKKILLLISCTAIGVIWALCSWIQFLYTPIVLNELGLKYQLHQGASYQSMTMDLYRQHVMKHPFFFKLLFHLRGDTHRLIAGEYLFPKGTTPSSMITQVVSGVGIINHAFTIVPGETFQQLRKALDKDNALKHTTMGLSDTDIMKRLGYPHRHPEGLFFPDTYYFVVDSSDLVLLKRAFQLMQKKLDKAWQQRVAPLPFQNAYQALIAASIIEKEAFLSRELPIIAGVLVNRLNRGMMLQFDPTVIYGVGDRFDGKIYKKDLLDKNPYNTYAHKGLPPTPICMPSLAAMNAVLHPDVHDYLYFVARADGVSHQFSQTLTQHYAAVVKARSHRLGYFNNDLIKRYLWSQLRYSMYP